MDFKRSPGDFNVARVQNHNLKKRALDKYNKTVLLTLTLSFHSWWSCIAHQTSLSLNFLVSIKWE